MQITTIIPADTPPGIYYLGAVIDAGNKVKEVNEKDNEKPEYNTEFQSHLAAMEAHAHRSETDIIE